MAQAAISIKIIGDSSALESTIANAEEKNHKSSFNGFLSSVLRKFNIAVENEMYANVIIGVVFNDEELNRELKLRNNAAVAIMQGIKSNFARRMPA